MPRYPNDIEGPILHDAGQWVVTRYGIESTADYYPWEAHRLGEVRPGTDLPDFVMHVGRKNWVNLEDLVTAFQRALEVHKGAYRGGFTHHQVMEAAAQTLKDRIEGRAYCEAFGKWLKAKHGGEDMVLCTTAEWGEFDDWYYSRNTAPL